MIINNQPLETAKFYGSDVGIDVVGRLLGIAPKVDLITT